MSRYNLPRWNYFRFLEKDLEACFRYVEPNAQHYSVHSDEFAKIILVACSEVENALQELAGFLEPKKRHKDLIGLRNSILAHFPHLPLSIVSAPRYGLKMQPWAGWDTNTPDWWTKGYNKLKHDRTGNPDVGTLAYALNALAALEVVLLYLYVHKYRVSIMPIECSPHLLDLEAFRDNDLESGFMGWGWELPDSEYAIQKRNRAKQRNKPGKP
jgi:hypothetical protein